MYEQALHTNTANQMTDDKTRITVTQNEYDTLRQAIEMEFDDTHRVTVGAYIRMLARERISELEDN